MNETIQRVGILGGGQLGWMLGIAAHRLGFETVFLDPAAECPVDALGHRIRASFDDPEALRELADRCEVATFEFENVPAAAIEHLSRHVPVRPGAKSLECTQDRLVEKRFLSHTGIPVPPNHDLTGPGDLDAAIEMTGLPAIMKTRRMGYDGKGQGRIASRADAETLIGKMSGPAILEGLVDFDFEASVLVVRGLDGDMKSWPPIANHHEDGILRCSRTPCSALTTDTAQRMREMAMKVAQALEHVGVLAVEFFVRGEEILANEIAPRVHNSGHVTNEFSRTSQFENHIRAITGLPLGDTEAAHEVGMMFNGIGDHPAQDSPSTNSWRRIDQNGEPSSDLRTGVPTWYDYRKAARAGRKLGHLTIVGDRVDDESIRQMVDALPGSAPPPEAWEPNMRRSNAKA